MLLLGHRAAHEVGAPVGVAAERAADLHDLLLVDDAPVSHVENRLEERVLVGDEPGVVAVADVGGDRLHRPGAVEGDDRDQILDRLGAELGDHVAHARGLELEDADALPLGEHREGVWIVERDAVRAKAGTAFGGLLLGVADDRQRAKAEEVHLEQPRAPQASSS